MRTSRRSLVLACILSAVLAASGDAQDRRTRVLEDREEFLSKGRWIYNDLERGFAEARKSGKPLLVVLRCIPCDACRGFDEEVAGDNPRIRGLLDRFVRVRIPQANGLDLSLFQFDYDLSFYAFFLGADRTIYGRFGSPSTQKDRTGAVSIDAFAEAMVAALDLHARRDAVRESLKAKTGARPQYRTPEEYPPLSKRYTSTIDYEGKVVQSCIHCHQVRDSERRMLRDARTPIPDEVLYPWPLPDVFGIHLDPRRRAKVERVDPGSVAERAGFRAGDELVALEGQPLISIADVQWVLHHAPARGRLEAKVRRGEQELDIEIPLEQGWRRASDISWRATTWDLRRMGTGGLLLEDLDAAERKRLGIATDALALRAKHVGQYGEHATAKRAGFRKGDIIVAVDGITRHMTEGDLIALAVQKKKPGGRLTFTVRRGDERRELSFAVR